MRSRNGRARLLRVMSTFALAAALSAGLCWADGTVSYRWTAFDTLESATTPEGTVSFTYDGDGQRISKTASGKTVFYVRDPAGQVMAEYDSTGKLIVEYVYVGNRRIARVSDTNSRHYYHTDVVGTPLVVSDQNGNEVRRVESLPFGAEVRASTPEPDPQRKRRFPGKELDHETGLHYFGARYYDSRLGRFVSVDPAGGKTTAPQTLNRYSYAVNNPFAFIDPDGRVVRHNQSNLDFNRDFRDALSQNLANLREPSPLLHPGLWLVKRALIAHLDAALSTYLPGNAEEFGDSLNDLALAGMEPVGMVSWSKAPISAQLRTLKRFIKESGELHTQEFLELRFERYGKRIVTRGPDGKFTTLRTRVEFTSRETGDIRGSLHELRTREQVEKLKSYDAAEMPWDPALQVIRSAWERLFKK